MNHINNTIEILEGLNKTGAIGFSAYKMLLTELEKAQMEVKS